MSVDKFYASIDENRSNLSVDSLTVLRRGDLVSFLQSCGPTYIRSIHRSSEIAVLYSFIDQLGNERGANIVSSQLSEVLFGNGETVRYSNYLEIDITASGIGSSLNAPGMISLQANDIQEMFNTLDHVYKNMMSDDIGLVSAVELMPWIANAEFQVAIAIDNVSQDDVCSDVNGNVISCDRQSSGEVASVQTGTFSRQLMKFNFMANSEHILLLEAKLNSDLSQLSKLDTCLNELHRIRRCDRNKFLQNYRVTSTMKTVQNLIDDFTDTQAEETLYMRKQQNFLDYIDHYYEPCIDQITSDADGLTGIQFFLTHWSSHEACEDTTCTLPGSIWNQTLASCVLTNDPIHSLLNNFCLPHVLVDQPKPACTSSLSVGDVLQPNQYLCNGSNAFGLGNGNILGKYNITTHGALQTFDLVDSFEAVPFLDVVLYVNFNSIELQLLENLESIIDPCISRTPNVTNPESIYFYQTQTCEDSETCLVMLNSENHIIRANETHTDTLSRSLG
mmetsp:Transcript_30781/g.70437  ORF Transcript_30781/g.70437 Transcript_30781/m.70437 type:complete len:504 (-) Transcript_30781:244-1755(-)